MSERITLRIKFSKHGALRFIGHLDVMRFFQKTIRRAQIDVSYTTGFSPHQIMSFASPLGVGLESNGEYLDIDVNTVTTCEDICSRLNRASVPGIEILSVKILPSGTKNAMASVAAASYTVRFRKGREPKTDIAACLPAFLSQEEILFAKETKNGVRQINLRDGIYDLRWEDGRVFMTVDASSAGNIKPVQVLTALLSQNGETLQENALLITREETFLNLGTPEEPSFAPMDAIGLDTPAKGADT